MKLTHSLLRESSIQNGDSDGNSAPPVNYWEHQVDEQVECNIDNQNGEVHGDQGPPVDSWEHQIDEKVEYNIDWAPLDTLGSMDCLLTVTNGNLNWKSMPSVQNAENLRECGNETISVKLKVSDETISPLMHKYLKIELHLYEANLLDTQVAEALIYFRDMDSITAGDLSLDESAKALKKHNTKAVATRSLIKVSFVASQVTLNISTQQRLLVQGFDNAEKHREANDRHGSRYPDLVALINSLQSQDTRQTIQIDLLIAEPLLRDGEKWTEILNDVFEVVHSADQAEDQMAQWFSKSAESHDMPLGHVPRVNDILPRGLTKQDPLVRFHNEDQYIVTQIVGAANKAFAEEAAARDLVSAEFAANVVPLRSSNDNSQFIVVITPKGRDIYLPALGESCHIKIPGIKQKNRVLPPDLGEATKSIIGSVEAHAYDPDAFFVTSVRKQLLKVMDPDKGADTRFTDADILDLRFHQDEDNDSENHEARLRKFVKSHAQFLRVETPEKPTGDEDVWFPATRMDSKIECVADDAQVYLASCPLEAKDDTDNVRRPISVELPFLELERSTRMDDYMKLVVEEQVDLKAVIRRDTSDKTIRAEVFAVNALHNPASANTAVIGDQSIEAFRYVQSFKRNEKTRSVNLLERFPVLLALSQSDGSQSALSECPQQIISQYLKLDAAKKSVINQLNDLPAGLAFIPGVAGSGKTELVKFIIAACIFGQGAARPMPALYLAPNNQAVDDMATKFQAYFDKLGLEGAPTIMRLYGLDFEVKSVVRDLAPGSGTSYQHFDEEKAQGKIEEMDAEAEQATDRAYQFLAVYQLEKMGCNFNQQNKNSRSKRMRSNNVSADTAAVAYYQTHIENYRNLQSILTISERDGSLSDDHLSEVRMLVKGLFQDMLFDFKGIICTTPVVAANVTVRRFQAELVFTDEAARQSELGSLISVAHYQPYAWFFLGDTAQLKPYVGQDSKATDNPFIRQMSVSLLERAVLAGVELGYLNITHRLRGSLCPLSSKIHYGGRMRNRGSPDWNWPSSTVAFSNEVTKLLGPSSDTSNSTRVVVQFPFARATLAGTSYRNITHVRWVLDQAKKMLQNPELTEIDSKKMASILILPLYKAQVDLYREKLHNERTQKRISDEHFRRIEVRTLDSAQGEERDVVIVDYVQTHKAGFCVDPNRNCLATTRAKQCEILIINAGMINSPQVENSKVGQILAKATERDIILK
ncbi:Regulator of nonsense transcripts 1, partial [Colletotrichum shisoi]